MCQRGFLTTKLSDCVTVVTMSPYSQAFTVNTVGTGLGDFVLKNVRQIKGKHMGYMVPNEKSLIRKVCSSTGSQGIRNKAT